MFFSLLLVVTCSESSSYCINNQTMSTFCDNTYTTRTMPSCQIDYYICLGNGLISKLYDGPCKSKHIFVFCSMLLYSALRSFSVLVTAQKMKFSIKDFFGKCDQIRSFLRIWSHLPKKSLMENFVFYAVSCQSLCN